MNYILTIIIIFLYMCRYSIGFKILSCIATIKIWSRTLLKNKKNQDIIILFKHTSHILCLQLFKIHIFE